MPLESLMHLFNVSVVAPPLGEAWGVPLAPPVALVLLVVDPRCKEKGKGQNQ